MVIMASGIARGRVRMTGRRRCHATWRPCCYREMHPRSVAEVYHLFFAGFSKKIKQTIAEVDLTFCTEAKKKKKKINRKQELTGGEVARESRGPELGK